MNKTLTLEYQDPKERTDRYYNVNTWYGTKLVLPFNMFTTMMEHNQTFDDLYRFIENYIKVRLTFCGDVSNRNIYIEYKGKLFSFGVYSDKNVGVSFWDESGCCSLGALKRTKNDIPDQDFIDDVQNIFDNYIEGNIYCSGCHTLIKREDIAGQYFAGRYCSECWESKYKAIEAKETYN